MPKKIYVEWCEPYGTDGKETVFMRMSVEDAIATRKQLSPASQQISDELALEDFIVIHWAQLVEEPKVCRNQNYSLSQLITNGSHSFFCCSPVRSLFSSLWSCLHLRK